MIYLVDLIYIGKYIPVPFIGQMIYFLLCMVSGYLLGSINTAIIVSTKKYGNDIRNFGSGNAGLTNMKRVYGWGAAGYTLLGDMGKQIAAVGVGMCLGHVPGAYIAGLFCIIGHILPCWYGFKGGKGVSTTYGVLLVVNVWCALIVGALHLLLIKTTKVVSISTIVSFVILPFSILIIDKGEGYINVIMTAIITVIVIYAHRENIKRLLKGEENSFKKEK